MLTWTAQLNVFVCVGHCFWKVPKSLVWSLQTSAVSRTRPCGTSWCACGGKFESCRKTDTRSTRTPETPTTLTERIKRKMTFRFRQRNRLDVNFLHKSTYIHFNHFFSNISYCHSFQYFHHLISTHQWFRSVMQNCSLTFFYNQGLSQQVKLRCLLSRPTLTRAVCSNEGGVISLDEVGLDGRFSWKHVKRRWLLLPLNRPVFQV